MKKITAALLGAGSRGANAYAVYGLEHPQELQFVAVAEPDYERRLKFQQDHQLSEEACFNSWEKLLELPKLADAILICTQDKMHFHPTLKALEKGYHVLLEKPMSPDPTECIAMSEYAERYNRVLSICHVLRFTSFFGTLKKVVDSGRIGDLTSIQHNENVAHWHQAHSFVRGNWYYAPKHYLTENINWITSAISNNTSLEARTRALREGPYGRCVYRCDNDVVDHQVVNMEFANGVTVAFTMCAFTNECSRTIKLMGTKGEIRGVMEKNELEVTDFLTGSREIIHLKPAKKGHGGGDTGIMRDFIGLVRDDGIKEGLTSAKISVQSHMMAFAAEKSRVEKKIVNIKEFYDSVKC